MKKLVVVSIVLLLLLVSFSSVFAAPWDNPNGSWINGIDCGSKGVHDVYVLNDQSNASFNEAGEVGVMKALYIDFGGGYQLIWSVKGKGALNNTTYCTWILDDLPMAGYVLLP